MKLPSLKRIDLVEIGLAAMAISAGCTAAYVGMEQASRVTKGQVISSVEHLQKHIGIEHVANAVDGGYDGGAVGLGIISAACILGIVWIEVTKLKLEA